MGRQVSKNVLSFPESEKPWKIMTSPEKVENLNIRVSEMEQVFGTAEKIWKYLKFATPALVVGLLASMNTESAGYKFFYGLAQLMGWV